MIRTLTTLLFGRPIGVLRLDDDGYCSFQYTDEFCASGMQPSPLQMPAIQNRTYKFPLLDTVTFNGLPGMMADSLPDSFGRALLEQWLTAMGREEESENVLERLSFQGKRCMGALEYRPSREEYLDESSLIEMDELVSTAREALSSKESFLSTMKDKEKMIADILKIGTSAGGQRAKAVIAVNDTTGEIRSGQVDCPDGFNHWILKFDGFDSNGRPTSPANYGRREYAFSKVARACGINMTECRLLEENGRAHFMTRRFDRKGNNKLHMQTLCAMSHYDFRRPGFYSYEQAFSQMRRMNLGYDSANEMFRRLVFNVMCLNMDDHTKNISFLMDRMGKWRLSPAYDIGFNYNPHGQWCSSHQMTINGKRDGITTKDLMEVAAKNDISNPMEIIREVEYGVMQFPAFADECGIPRDETDYVTRLIKDNWLH